MHQGLLDQVDSKDLLVHWEDKVLLVHRDLMDSPVLQVRLDSLVPQAFKDYRVQVDCKDRLVCQVHQDAQELTVSSV